LADAALLGPRPLSELLFGKVKELKGFDAEVMSYNHNGNSPNQARRKVLVLRSDLYTCTTDGYLQSMMSDDNTTEHVLLTIGRIEWVLTNCKFRYWDDFNAERLKQWLYKQRTTRDDFGTKTSNHYIKAMRTFANWCRKELKRQGAGNPFDDIELINTTDDVRRKRRVATPYEIAKIIEATNAVGDVTGLNAEDRAMLYQVALTTGLRAKECASLSPESFIDEEGRLSVRVAASDTKNRKEALIPVPEVLSSLLRPWLAKKANGERLWPGRWCHQAATVLRRDLAEADIPYETAEGTLDFHAARHTAITRSSRVMNVVDLKAFARHAKIETTMGYVHTDKEELRRQVDLLPLVGVDSAEQHPNGRTKKRDRACDHAGVPACHQLSSKGENCHCPGNDTTPCKCKGLSSTDIEINQRARRDSNPQLPDRQSGTLTN